MLFLSRDAVVRESGGEMVLVARKGPVVAAVVLGAAPPGPGQRAQDRLLAGAAATLRDYLHKITGVACPIAREGASAALLANGSFEAPPMPGKQRWASLSGTWSAYHNREHKAAVSLDKAVLHTGKAAATIRGVTGPALVGALQHLTIQQNKRYRLSLWYRTRTDKSGGACLAIPHLKTPIRLTLPPAKGWTRYEKVFTAVQPRGNWLVLILAMTGSQHPEGQVWFDDVALEEVRDKTAPAPVVPSRKVFLGVGADEFPELKKAKGHGFLIASKGKDLHIVGATAAGTRFGVWFFLMNYAGLRIVMPGELGEVYEPLDSLRIPEKLYVLNPGPDFLLRIWSQPDFDHTAWLSDSSTTSFYQFHHNMYRIYAPKRFAKTHPEYFPVRGGQRRIPTPGAMSRWQPNFSSPAVVQRACDYADEIFSANPLMRSISLTVNDGGGYSGLDLAKAKAAGSLSNVYYAYVNAVARHVQKRWPGKSVACVAYHGVAPPPDFRMEENAIIFFMNEAKVEIDKWRPKAKHFGVYQWLYGKWWAIPNHWPHAMQEYLRWFRGQGGVLFKAENYGNWAHDGAKAWVQCNLLWNVDAYVDALLADYYEHMVGKEAAAAVARFYRRAEEIYERRRTKTRYIFSYDSVFDKEVGFNWKPATRQFRHMTPDDVKAMAAALREAEGLVRGDANRKRLGLTRRAFDLACMYLEEYRLYEGLSAAPVRTRDDIGRVVEAAGALMERVRARRAFCREHIDPSWQTHGLAHYYRARGGAKPPDHLDWERIDSGWLLDWEGSILNALLKAVSASAQATLTRQANPTIQSVHRVLDELIPDPKDPVLKRVRLYSSKYYFARKTAHPPTVDGRLDDACWRDAEVESGFVKLRSGDRSQHKSEFMLRYDARNLYLAYRGFQDTSKLVAYASARDDKVWHDDSMEFVIHRPEAKGRGFYHFIVNSKGRIYDWVHGDKSFNTTAAIAAGIRPDRYVVECAIPFGELRQVGVHPKRRFVKMNVMRNFNGEERLDDPAIVSSWYFTRGSNLHVDSRGWLCFVP